MTRTFTPVDLVQLPRIDANGAIALVTAVESAAAPFHDLPPLLTETLGQMGADKQTLLAALAKTPGTVMTVKEADRRIDKVGGAFHDIGAAWATLAEFLPQGEEARTLMERVFQDGRRFVNLKVKEEWAAIETKLVTIEREGLQAHVDAIGAGPILTLLKQFQSEYGAVIGTTQAIEEAPEIRESKDALLDSLRTYVLQVAGTVKRGKPETTTRADALLKPVREWESTKATKEKNDQAEPGTGAPVAGEPSSTGTTGG